VGLQIKRVRCHLVLIFECWSQVTLKIAPHSTPEGKRKPDGRPKDRLISMITLLATKHLPKLPFLKILYKFKLFMFKFMLACIYSFQYLMTTIK
jgi:hypothetical protein